MGSVEVNGRNEVGAYWKGDGGPDGLLDIVFEVTVDCDAGFVPFLPAVRAMGRHRSMWYDHKRDVRSSLTQIHHVVGAYLSRHHTCPILDARCSSSSCKMLVLPNSLLRSKSTLAYTASRTLIVLHVCLVRSHALRIPIKDSEACSKLDLSGG
jgi:hypothetical protein